MGEPYPTVVYKGRLIIEAIPSTGRKKQLYRVLEDIEYNDGQIATTVPAGFVTDFATIPWIAQLIVDDDDPVILLPAIFHDYYYVTGGGPVLNEGVEYRLSKKEADQLMVKSMRTLGAGWFIRSCVYLFIRLFGKYGPKKPMDSVV